MLRTGFESEAKEQIKRNAEIFKGEKILTSCAGCYKTLKEDYEDLDVIHISQLLDELIRVGKLDFTKKDLDVCAGNILYSLACSFVLCQSFQWKEL